MRRLGSLLALGFVVALALPVGSAGPGAVPEPEADVAASATALRQAPALATRDAPVAAPPPPAPTPAPALPARQRTLRGRVTDPDGRGVGRIPVEVQFSHRRQRVPVFLFRAVETDPHGAFAVPIPPRASVALVWAPDTAGWSSHPGVTVTGWGLVFWHRADGGIVKRDAKGRPWNPADRTPGAWPEVRLRVRPARTLRGRVAADEGGPRAPDLRVPVEARWPDEAFGSCVRQARADERGCFELQVPCDAARLDVGLPVRTKEQWDDERNEVIEVLCEEGAPDDAIEAALGNVRAPHPGFWLPPLRPGEDDVVLRLPRSHELAYEILVDGRPLGAREAHIRVVREERDGIDPRPHCTRSKASGLAAGRHRLVVRSVAMSDGEPAFTGSMAVQVPGPPVRLACRRR